MPQYNVTSRWLREKIAELDRMARIYMTSAAYESYFARISGYVGGLEDSAIILREQLNKTLAYFNDLEDKQDNV